jgi:hypothetical protein
MLNLDTNAIIKSRDIIWLKKMHVDWLKNKLTMNLEEEDVLELLTGNESNKVEEEATHLDVDEKKKKNEKILCEMRKLESWFNPQASKIVDELDSGMEIVLEQVNLALLTTSLTKEPSSFEEAINCQSKDDQKTWKEAIEKELNEMTKRGVWEVIDEKKVPNDRRFIKKE